MVLSDAKAGTRRLPIIRRTRLLKVVRLGIQNADDSNIMCVYLVAPELSKLGFIVSSASRSESAGSMEQEAQYGT